jgi:hypothetical protein
MQFKDRILKKIEIDMLADRVLDSLKAVEFELKVDKDAMRALLAAAGYRPHTERDLEIYCPENGEQGAPILVLDNELSLFRSTIADVAMRRSPTLKEMLTFRKALKIIRDQDIRVTRKAETVSRIQQEALAGLDATYTMADIENLCAEGRQALKKGLRELVREDLMVMAEVFGLRPPPKIPVMAGMTILGLHHRPDDGPLVFGPSVLYNEFENGLKWFEDPLMGPRGEKKETFQDMALGKIQPDLEGGEVWGRLAALAEQAGQDQVLGTAEPSQKPFFRLS